MKQKVIHKQGLTPIVCKKLFYAINRLCRKLIFQPKYLRTDYVLTEFW